MIIDTNVYSALRLNKGGALSLAQYAKEILLPLPVIAELKLGFELGSQTEKNTNILDSFLGQEQVSILFPAINTAQHYARLASYCRRRGRALGHNDLWIASLAYEHNSEIATYDKDFEVFQDLFGDKLIILSD